MAFDGIIMAALTADLKRALVGGRISKIAMPEKDELLITIKNNSENYKLLISAGASLPLIYLTDENKQNPAQAATFCMLLRKYLSTAKIISVEQDGLERIITISLEHLDDLGDIAYKKLIVEIMGKYSNIIMIDEKGLIVDSIKRVPLSVSSLREVLPRKHYIFPDKLEKEDPLKANADTFKELIKSQNTSIIKALYVSYAGISPLIAQEICCMAGVDCDKDTLNIADEDLCRLYKAFADIIINVRNTSYSPTLITRNGKPIDFAPFHLKLYESFEYEQIPYDSVSLLLRDYYSSRDSYTRMRQKTADLRKLLTNFLERAVKKYDLQAKQLKDCEGKGKYKVYGDLLNTYGYSLKGGEKSFECENYYDNNKLIAIPLDINKTANENAKRYYDKYAKLRRTEIALGSEIEKTEAEIEHLQSILASLDTSEKESDLNQIREELVQFGYIKKSIGKNKNQGKSEPLKFKSSDGYDILVGKNNYQNEEITFGIATGNDIWFHVKNAPGSHVIVRCNQPMDDVPDRLFQEAAGLAAYYSSKKDNEKVEVDYTQKKNLKRVAGSAPGFVIYHTNYSMIAAPKIL